VQLSLQNRRVGYVTVVKCRGRIVAGPESAALLKHLDGVIPTASHILLHLGEIDFVDSSGLGLLVRCLTRVENASGQLSLCALSSKLTEVLKITRLDKVLRPYYTETDAIADVHQRAARDTNMRGTVLCVDPSADVLAYIRELLKGAGHRVLTAENLSDGLILLTATQPGVVVIGNQLHEVRDVGAAEEFHRRAATRGRVVLPPDFSSRDAGDAARSLIDMVRAILAEPGAPPATV
jgi:anti-sigma B factor antagonist